ncbi:MAG: nucleotidyltransferase domain-containing protein [bacterium]
MNQKNILIIRAIKKRLHTKFDFIKEVILFGSQASEKAHRFSDYDILIIVKYPLSWQQEREVVDEVYYIDLQYDILTDVKIISTADLETLRGKQPYIRYALQEGIKA